MSGNNGKLTTPERFVKLPLDILARTNLTPADKIIYAYIVNRIEGRGSTWPGVRTIGAKCGVSRTTTAEAVNRLASAGLIEIDKPQGNPAGRSNTYTLPAARGGETYQNPDVPE